MVNSDFIYLSKNNTVDIHIYIYIKVHKKKSN